MSDNLLFQLAVYLGATIIIVPIVKKFKLSSVLGYLIAGIVIGPYILGLVGQDTKKQETVMHFAEFGVVMMLFLIGLELRPALLWKLKTSILGLGGLQVLITSTIFSFNIVVKQYVTCHRATSCR